MRGSFRIKPLQSIAVVLITTWLVCLPFVSTTTELRQHTQVIIAVLAVLGVNIATGYGGMISLGHGVFVGIGAFATGYFVDEMSFPWILAICMGIVTASLSGALVGIPALRIKGIHLALLTLCMAIVFQPLSKRFPAFTGGVSGKAIEARFEAPLWFGDSRMASAVYRYVFCILVVLFALGLTWNLVNSRAGRAMRALRDNDTAAAIYGVNLVRTRVITFSISAGLAGLAGALQVVLVPYVSQANYTVQESLVVYATAVIGGLGSIWGSVLGVVARTGFGALGERLSGVDGFGFLSEFFELLDEQAFVFGVGLIALTFIFPGGLAGIGTKNKRQAGN
ncbi:MAG: branched-chain amino acid ABC transporter permease [Actinomycetota bacterium]|nr:branched-chain amino acid ABC transporter permease [Actinomycetota bacterium]MDG2121211.1 branched-chain amino acid ABC transporter permease [Actinomycetota bacterium]